MGAEICMNLPLFRLASLLRNFPPAGTPPSLVKGIREDEPLNKV